MLVKGASSDVFRVSISSTHSTSSQGSAHDDCDSFGDVYVWGEVLSESSTVDDDSQSTFSEKTDVLLPRPLVSNILLDVQHVACGVGHAALVTKQGELFTWGEEAGGRLGHGVGTDVIQPRLVESLAVTTIDFVACGEYHTCAITTDGELYTWGDGTHNLGLLGHGTDVCHWVPKRISGSLEGIPVVYISCGIWHSALITSSRQLFTFGDGTFGVLGHGNRESVTYPREVESLMGLKTITVACGVWHTAALVEVITTTSNVSVSSGKLFTWGDGDKHRLGHNDKEPRLKPTCVNSLIDYNLCKLACGHSLTVGLTTSGRVFTMGSTVYGQLGNPNSDGRMPCLVEDKLSHESVEDIACGSYHVAVLTAKNEVYTWGKGSNGRLGHGDIEDRKTPTLVEALKDRPVKRVACGSNFTAAICHHKWVSGAEQVHCSSCKHAFGFTRKRHHCYNCGLVYCHSCSSRKALRASLSSNPAKFSRVCDSCFLILDKVKEPRGVNGKINMLQVSGEAKELCEKVDQKVMNNEVPSSLSLIKHLDTKAAKHGKFSLLNLKDIVVDSASILQHSLPKSTHASTTYSVTTLATLSPFPEKPTSPLSVTHSPVISGFSISNSFADSLKETNQHLTQEVEKLSAQVESLRQRCELQEFELKKSEIKVKDANDLAAEELAKSKAAKEVVKCLTAQLKLMAEKLPGRLFDGDDTKSEHLANGVQLRATQYSNISGDDQVSKTASSGQCTVSPASTCSPVLNGIANQIQSCKVPVETHQTIVTLQSQRVSNSRGGDENTERVLQSNKSGILASSCPAESANGNEPGESENSENGTKSANYTSPGNQVEAEWIEQYEPGVYITLIALRNGTRDLKRVRFSRRRFGEHQAATWWSENREKVYEKYNVQPSDRSSSASTTQPVHRSEEFCLSPQSWQHQYILTEQVGKAF